jgi:hypothetical protein
MLYQEKNLRPRSPPAHGLKANMKNMLMPMGDKNMLRKKYIIECINELLKNKEFSCFCTIGPYTAVR